MIQPSFHDMSRQAKSNPQKICCLVLNAESEEPQTGLGRP
jgi:hypothetical protein